MEMTGGLIVNEMTLAQIRQKADMPCHLKKRGQFICLEPGE